MWMWVHKRMWSSVELSHTSLVLGGQDGAKTNNQHEDILTNILVHSHYVFHIEMHTWKYSLKLEETFTYLDCASHTDIKILQT